MGRSARQVLRGGALPRLLLLARRCHLDAPAGAARSQPHHHALSGRSQRQGQPELPHLSRNAGRAARHRRPLRPHRRPQQPRPGPLAGPVQRCSQRLRNARSHLRSSHRQRRAGGRQRQHRHRAGRLQPRAQRCSSSGEQHPALRRNRRPLQLRDRIGSNDLQPPQHHQRARRLQRPRAGCGRPARHRDRSPAQRNTPRLSGQRRRPVALARRHRRDRQRLLLQRQRPLRQPQMQPSAPAARSPRSSALPRTPPP